MRRIFLIIYSSANDQLRNWGSLLGTSIFLVFILFIFAQLWQTIAADRAWDISPTLMIWYLALTEVVIMAIPRISQAIEADYRNDRITTLFIRPLGYFRQKFAEFLGAALMRMVVIFIVSSLAAAIYTGRFPMNLYDVPVIIFTLLLGTILALIHLFIIGLSTIWLGDSTPLTWLYQKLQFILGGLMIPIHFYPGWLKDFSLNTPFSVMIYGPASLLFDSSADRIWELLLMQIFWIGISFAVVCLIGKLAVLRLSKLGG